MDWVAIIGLLAQVDWYQVFTILVTILFFISELLGNIPQIKENSIYQIFMKFLRLLKDKFKQGQKPKKQKEGPFEDGPE